MAPVVPPTPAKLHTIPNQTKVEQVIDKRVSGDQANDNARFAKKGTTVIASPTAPGATYSQTEMASLKTAIDAIRAALTASGVTN